VLLNEPALPTQSLRIARERLDEARGTLRSIDSRGSSQAAPARSQVSASEGSKSAEKRRDENIALRQDIAKLAALVDHYYTAFRESHILLGRRDRELAELRRGLSSRPVPLP
jgi:hypothetical protein